MGQSSVARRCHPLITPCSLENRRSCVSNRAPSDMYQSYSDPMPLLGQLYWPELNTIIGRHIRSRSFARHPLTWVHLFLQVTETWRD